MTDPVSSTPSGQVPPPLSPPQTVTPARDRAGDRPDAGLIIAAVWLACSLIVGLWLMISSHSIASDDVSVQPIAGTSRAAYGGDAYTGIQNAAADTASAVKALAQFDDANARIGRRVSSRADIGIGFIVISIGVVNFNLALRRRSAS